MFLSRSVVSLARFAREFTAVGVLISGVSSSLDQFAGSRLRYRRSRRLRFNHGSFARGSLAFSFPGCLESGEKPLAWRSEYETCARGECQNSRACWTAYVNRARFRAVDKVGGASSANGGRRGPGLGLPTQSGRRLDKAGRTRRSLSLMTDRPTRRSRSPAGLRRQL